MIATDGHSSARMAIGCCWGTRAPFSVGGHSLHASAHHGARTRTLSLSPQVLHFLAGVPYMSTLLRTLSRASSQLIYFLIILFVLINAFAISFHLAAGTQMHDWRDLGSSYMSLLFIILGDVDLFGLHRANRVVGPLLYIAFVFFILFVVVNIFLAIVRGTYEEEKKAAISVDLVAVFRDATFRQFRQIRASCRLWNAHGRDRSSQMRKQGASFYRSASSFSRSVTDRASSPSPKPADRHSCQRSESRSESLVQKIRAQTAAEAAAAEEERSFSKQEHSASEKKRTLNEMARSEGLSTDVASSRDVASRSTLNEMARSKGAMEGGHLFILNGVSTQLKSMCFRQDARDASVRMPIQAAISGLDRLRVLNESLKERARRDGWEWHLGSNTLVPAMASASTAFAASSKQHAHSAHSASRTETPQRTIIGAPAGVTTQAPAAGLRTSNAFAAIVHARQLARGSKAKVFGTGTLEEHHGAEVDREADADAALDNARGDEVGLRLETAGAGHQFERKLTEVRSPGAGSMSPSTRKRKGRKHHQRHTP